MKSKSVQYQSGAVSIFVVVFAILLMSVVTVSFLRIMINDQNQASSNDLAQSAYDSAQAGVEDAKRALVWYASQCKTLSPDECNALAVSMASSQCNQAVVNVAQVVKAGDISDTEGGAGVGEVKVQQSTADESGNNPDAALNQAYTCVTMTLNTEDYVGNVSVNQPVLIPLITTSSFDTVTVEWFNRDDVSNTDGNVSVPSTPGNPKPLLAQANWGNDTPPVLRAQYMQVGDNFTLDSFDYYRSDADPANAQSNTNTLFLYPHTGGNGVAIMTDRDIRRSESGTSVPSGDSSTPLPVRCSTNVSSGNYSCTIRLDVPRPIDGGNAETAYLLLTPLYTSTHFRVSLQKTDGTTVLFKGVQPMVDSTGRASDVFRRVQSRIDLYATNPYISGAVDITGNFCKDFGVTDVQYIDGSCTP